MKKLLAAFLGLAPLLLSAEEPAPPFDARATERFARLALACVHQEYPNKINHVLNSDADVAPPLELTPALSGCYDWHSSGSRALEAGQAGPHFSGDNLRGRGVRGAEAKPSVLRQKPIWKRQS